MKKPIFKNIKNFIPVDLGGDIIPITDINKIIGNSVYFSANDLSICETGRKIYAEQDFEVTDQLRQSLKNIQNVAPWLLEQFEQFLKE